jgi:osmotically-inducible protein OsmY
MRPTSLIRVFATVAMIGTFAGCTSSSRTSETTGEYADDAAITAKVKAAILAEPGLESLQIGVETYKDVVELSGFVDSNQVKTHAGNVAAGVHGVRSVRNELVVK